MARGGQAPGCGHGDRLGVAVREGVVEPPLDNGFGRRVGAGTDSDLLLPEPEVAQDALDHLVLNVVGPFSAFTGPAADAHSPI